MAREIQLETAVVGLSPVEASPRAVSRPVSVPARLVVRFVTAYLVLYNLPFPLNALPASVSETLLAPYVGFWRATASLVAARLFSIRLTVFENGSGDTTYNFVQVFCLAVLAGAVTVGWTLAFRKRATPEALRRWSYTYLSLSLAFEMALYGASKVFPGQFPPLTLDRLVQPIGNASPMGLLWTFMSVSRGFALLTGATEMLGGVLLTIRRTRLLGALVCCVVMTVVFALNLCYDVPVKLFSGHLLFMAGFIALPHFRRMLDFFVLNRPVAAEPAPPPISNPKIRRAATVGYVLLACWIPVYPLWEAYADTVQDRTYSSPSPLYGIWRVDELMADPLAGRSPAANEFRWKRVIFDLEYYLAVQHQDDGREVFFCEFDLEKRTITLFRRESPKERFELRYEENGPEELKLVGTIDGVSIRARLRRIPIPEFRLKTRGFHLISEYPFNR